jgi:two-component system, cell cycle response regulator DivK
MRAKQLRQADNRKKILVVDDEPLNMKLFALTLNKRGYEVLQASNGFHAFVIANDELPDLIVMDVRMPNLNGLQVTRSLKDNNHTRKIPVLIATAFLIDEEELKESGCDAYIAKPFATRKFVDAVNALLNEAVA